MLQNLLMLYNQFLSSMCLVPTSAKVDIHTLLPHSPDQISPSSIGNR